MSLKSPTRATVLATVLAVGLVVSACSGSDGGDGDAKAYCTDLKASAAEVKALSGGDLDGLDRAFGTARRLADEAPPAVSEDWGTIDQAIEDVQGALDEAGLTIADLQKIQSGGELPAGVDLAELGGLSKVYADISGPEFASAQDAIVAHAKKACDVDLTVS